MIYALAFFVFTTLLATASTAFVSYKLYKLGLKVLDIEESIETCLDKIDIAYRKTFIVSKQNDAFTSDPRLVAALNSLKSTREAINQVVNELTNEFDKDEESEENR